MTLEDKIKKELVKTVGVKRYNGWDNRTTYGYHSYKIGEVNIPGQRQPKIRLDGFKKYIEFADKVVIDFGCNVGAMLHHLPEIKLGVGFDYDENCINSANNIAKLINKDNLSYHTHDFDKDGYDNLLNKITEKPNIILLLSLGSWVSTWRELYSLALEYDAQIILEINNEDEGKSQLDFFTNKGYEPKMIVNNSSDDLTGNNRRRTYLIEK